MQRKKAPSRLWWDGTDPCDYEPDKAAVLAAGDLTQLADVFGSDKGNLGNAHGYTRAYERIITPTNTAALCEIGVACGASLKMWSTYLPEARIVGIDVRPDCRRVCSDYPRIEIIIADVLDLEYNSCFDVVIDDSSHIAEDITRFASHCWAWVRPGGLYIVEDAACTYSHTYTADYNERFNASKTNDRRQFLELIDDLMRNADERRDVAFIEYHPQLLIIHKSNGSAV